MSVLKPGDNLHIAEARGFEGAVRRHFVGRVEEVSEAAFRIKGVVFIQNRRTGEFERKPGSRTRVYSVHARVVINILDPAFNVAEASYGTDEHHRLSVLDGEGHSLDIHEFAGGVHH